LERWGSAWKLQPNERPLGKRTETIKRTGLLCTIGMLGTQEQERKLHHQESNNEQEREEETSGGVEGVADKGGKIMLPAWFLCTLGMRRGPPKLWEGRGEDKKVLSIHRVWGKRPHRAKKDTASKYYWK